MLIWLNFTFFESFYEIYFFPLNILTIISESCIIEPNRFIYSESAFESDRTEGESTHLDFQNCPRISEARKRTTKRSMNACERSPSLDWWSCETSTLFGRIRSSFCNRQNPRLKYVNTHEWLYSTKRAQ